MEKKQVDEASQEYYEEVDEYTADSDQSYDFDNILSKLRQKDQQFIQSQAKPRMQKQSTREYKYQNAKKEQQQSEQGTSELPRSKHKEPAVNMNKNVDIDAELQKLLTLNVHKYNRNESKPQNERKSQEDIVQLQKQIREEDEADNFQARQQGTWIKK